MKTFFQITPANGYAMLMPSPKDEASYLAKMNDGIQFWQAARGVPLRSRWNDDWEFVVDPEFDCSKGAGDLAEMNRLIAARRRGFEFLNPLLGRFSEVLHGTYGGEELWLFNVISRIPKARKRARS